ncbi:MAG: hypothetical protein JXB05_06925 [Myxococcaceae bacterium]|nr:hypothetical protein [Myxococcaceae bacterium]
MSLRTFALPLLTLTLASGCGEAPPSDAGLFAVELSLSQTVAEQLAAFQVVVLPNGRQRDCEEIQKRCLREQVRQNEALVLRDGQGAEGRALRFPANLSGSAQDVSIEVPVGRDYALVIEALSGDTPPRFLGSSCNYLTEVNASRNAPVLAAPITLTPVECDPTFSP